MMVCNPPYVPRPKSIDDNPYEGLSLLNYLLWNGNKFLNEDGYFVSNYSSLCEPPFVKMLKDHNEKCTKLGFKWEYETRKIRKTIIPKPLKLFHAPLKVMAVLNNKEWMAYLKKRAHRLERHPGYGYSHDLHVVALRMKYL